MSVKTSLLALAPAKINLFLHVTGRRTDGYHLLQSLFCPITLSDTVQIDISPAEGPVTQIDRTGDLLHIPAEVDLTVRACKAFYLHAGLKQAFHLTLHITKNIPEQAGLGGGSSNAAAVLRQLQQYHAHPLTAEQLSTIALALGADVPFFLQDHTAFVEGIGEKIDPIPGVAGALLVYKPPLSCATAKIFSDPQLTRNSSDVKIAVFDSVRRANSELLACLQANTQNALQAVVETQFPEWKRHFDVFSGCVRQFNPLLVRMSGSGSAMFAVFASPNERSNALKAVANEPELQTGQWFECEIGWPVQVLQGKPN